MWGHQLHGAMKLWGGELRTWGIWGRGTSATPLFQTYQTRVILLHLPRVQQEQGQKSCSSPKAAMRLINTCT